MNLLNKALRHVSGWSRTTWCLAILMTVAFVLIGRLAQLQVLLHLIWREKFITGSSR